MVSLGAGGARRGRSPATRDKLVKDSLLRVAHHAGFDVVDRTERGALRDLIRALRPVDGGFPLVRLGPDGDGGYLVPDDLAGIEHAFSPGVSTESGFDLDLAERGLRVYLADHSVDGPPRPHPRFVFDKKHVGALSDERCMTLDEWKDRHLPGYGGDLLLQMDIEGAEFEALMSASAELLRQFRIMVIEFHYLQELLNEPFFRVTQPVFRRLLETHAVVHIHPNNCCGSVRWAGLEIPRVAEFTLHRRDRLRRVEPARTFPHPLDRDNTRHRTLPLHPCWYAD